MWVSLCAFEGEGVWCVLWVFEDESAWMNLCGCAFKCVCVSVKMCECEDECVGLWVSMWM